MELTCHVSWTAAVTEAWSSLFTTSLITLYCLSSLPSALTVTHWQTPEEGDDCCAHLPTLPYNLHTHTYIPDTYMYMYIHTHTNIKSLWLPSTFDRHFLMAISGLGTLFTWDDDQTCQIVSGKSELFLQLQKNNQTRNKCLWQPLEISKVFTLNQKCCVFCHTNNNEHRQWYPDIFH